MVFKFTIDNVLNKYIPENKLKRLPPFIGRFLGAHSPSPRADYLIWLETLIGTFVGLSLLEGVFKSHTVFTKHNAPIIIASYGASAILCFNASQAPLAQPRSVFFGHFLSSLIGLCVQKLFSLSSGGRDHYWASGSLSVAIASVAMSICNCVHPPAGASALLPSIDDEIRSMSWWYLPVQIISSLLIISVACITGNIVRSYPVYWWTPAPLGKKVEPPKEDEKAENISHFSTDDAIEGITYIPNLTTIQISANEILVPEDLNINEIDVEWIDGLRLKLRKLPEQQSRSEV
ncbi:HPP family-domain-containing protein [Scheffersomyces xylosifermentans]|uniref:HPP family-domain-containing protein n=1 Tax=Scheffersomyces xylosifermentans TaxID=1304137 RepID=UPI00315DFCD3